jgi:hypothetical protein
MIRSASTADVKKYAMTFADSSTTMYGVPDESVIANVGTESSILSRSMRPGRVGGVKADFGEADVAAKEGTDSETGNSKGARSNFRRTPSVASSLWLWTAKVESRGGQAWWKAEERWGGEIVVIVKMMEKSTMVISEAIIFEFKAE